MDLYQQYQNLPLEVLEATLSSGKLSDAEAEICRKVIQEKRPSSAPIAHSHSTEDSDDYQTGITAAKIVSFAGWLVVMGSFLFGGFLFHQSADILRYARGETTFLAVMGILGSTLGVMISGLLMVIAGQAARAVMDNANHSRRMLLTRRCPPLQPGQAHKNPAVQNIQIQ